MHISDNAYATLCGLGWLCALGLVGLVALAALDVYLKPFAM